jgi:hypothetical protein
MMKTRRLRKPATLAASFALVFAMSACSDDNGDPVDPDPTATTLLPDVTTTLPAVTTPVPAGGRRRRDKLEGVIPVTPSNASHGVLDPPCDTCQVTIGISKVCRQKRALPI